VSIDADMAQLVARCADNAKVSGSSPDIRMSLFGNLFLEKK
jgi:hypothetical protein